MNVFSKITKLELIILVVIFLAATAFFTLPLREIYYLNPCGPDGWCPQGPVTRARLATDTALLFSAMIVAIGLFAISFNRIRKNIIEFGGWKAVTINNIISWVAIIAITAILIRIFWNKSVVYVALILGPVIGGLGSSYFLTRRKMILFTIFSISSLLVLLSIIVFIFAVLQTFAGYPLSL